MSITLTICVLKNFTNRNSKVPKQKLRLEAKLKTSIVTDVCMGIFLAALLMVNTISKQPLNNVFMTMDVPLETTVCADQYTFTVEYLNTSDFPLTNQEVIIELPDGVRYIPGSVNAGPDYQVNETNINDLYAPVFSVADLPDGETVTFSIDYEVSIPAMVTIQTGGTLKNKVVLSTNEGEMEQVSPTYNALYAALSIKSITPAAQSLISGDTMTRAITVINGGYGKLSSFFLTDIHNGGIELISTDIGTLNATKDTMFFTSIDFQNVGNGDEFFDTYESLLVTEKITLSGCDVATTTSSINAGWSCEGQVVENATMNANVSAVKKMPNLSLSTKSALSTCFGPKNANTQELTIKNTGEGPAVEVEVDIWKSKNSAYNQDIYSRIDTASITYSVNGGTPRKISAKEVKSTISTGNYACLGANPIGSMTISLPNIAAKATVKINWDTYNCCVDVCNNETNTGWRASLAYNDACMAGVKTVSKLGEKNLRGAMSVFVESPSDLGNGDMGTYSFTISSARNDFPVGPTSNYQLEFAIPLGLKWRGVSEDLVFFSGNKYWTPSSVEYDNRSRILKANYPLPEPFKLPKSEIQLKLQADCSELAEEVKDVEVNLSVSYIIDTTCEESCSIPFLCVALAKTTLHCPGPCSEGLAMNSFDIKRISLGLSDNNQDGLPDTQDAIDINKVKLNRVMMGDTLRSTFRGKVVGSKKNLSWSFAYGKSTIELGTNLQAIGATVKVFDASENAYILCDNVGITSAISGKDQTFTFDFSPTRVKGICDDFHQYKFEDGDSIWLYTDYKVTGNIGGLAKEVDVENEFYLSKGNNPDGRSEKFACNNWGGRFTLIGYFFKNEKSTKTTISSCSKYISQDFKLSIGDCCSNYNGGNLFPYEYRQWAHVKRAQFTIPDHYVIQDIYLRHRRTRSTNTSITQTLNDLQIDSVSGNTYFFDLEQYFKAYGGTLDLSDDGFFGTMYVELAPTCDVPENVYQEVDWKFTFQESEWLSNTETDWYTSSPDQIKYSPASLILSSPNPVIDGLGKNISWTLNVKSGGSGSNNAWIHTQTPNGDINITSIVDVNTGDTLQMTGDIYQIGQIGSNLTRKFSINAIYTMCEPSYIMADAGFECSGYPNSFDEFKCSYTSKRLDVEPEDAELQMRISGKRTSENCVNYTDFTVQLASVKLGHANNIVVDVQMPELNHMSLVPNTTSMTYPMTLDPVSISDPQITNQKFSFNIDDFYADIKENGLPGVNEIESSRLEISFRVKNDSAYEAGDLITIHANSEASCGQALPSVTVPYDVNLRFFKPNLGTLTNALGHSWSGAWGDFNNDGYEDLYVAEFAHWKSGKLFINRGDGRFKESTEAGPPIQDKGASAGATWGDYDNDGDLDLFVSNNVRAVNHLYENNGDGTFTRKDDAGDISSYEGYCHNAAWIDYDNDGWLDMFVSDYMPTRYNQLYHNNGDGTFSRATDNPIALEAKFSMGATWADYDNDGMVDLFVPNGRGDNNSLYHNDGNGKFTKITSGDIVNDGGNSTGSSWGDYDNDGDMDLFVSNASNEDNFFYVNNGDGTFKKERNSVIVQDKGHSHGSGWADMDKDGYLDLFVANDAGNVNFFYQNNGDGTFRRSDAFDEDLENTMAVAFADYDIDGDLDLFLANNGNQSNTMYLNEADPCVSWKCFQLEGVRSNKSAVGAKVRVKATIYGKSVWQTREISTQTGGGASSQSTIRAYFGLGDATNIDSVIIDWPSGFEQHLTNLATQDCQTVVEEDGAEICGVAYYDVNNNCVQDPGEAGIPNMLLEVLPGPKYVTTNDKGEYRIYREYGTYTIRTISTDEWSSASRCDSSHTIVYESANKASSLSFCGKDFAMTPKCPMPDLVTYLSSTALRRGFQNSYAISFLNRGALAASDLELVVEFDNDIIPIAADVPWDKVNVGPTFTEYIWLIGKLDPMDQGTIMVVDSVSANATLGRTAEVRATFRNAPEDCNVSNNTKIDLNEIVGAVDPNDILVSPEGAILPNDTLTYKIRFQNVGTKFAQRVVIKDTISPYLSLASLQIESASHSYRYEISEDRVLTFTFDRIFLPDSVSNEAASHGFVQYTIKPGESIPMGSIILNRAAIQFDYNEYIITNTVSNKVVNSLALAEQEKLELRISPNPLEVESLASIHHTEQANVQVNIRKLEIYSSTGVLVYSLKNLDYPSVSIRKGHLQTGVYIVKAYDRNGFSYSHKLEVK